MSDRKKWSGKEHESKVENFYGSGIEGYHNYHNGYLNFGYWTRAGMTYEEAAENLVRHMGGLLGLGNNSKLLDCGCGMGTQDIFLLKSFSPNSIDALDVTWKHIERARERAKREGVDNGERLRFHHGSATELPFAQDSFTHLLSIEAPEHFDTREKFFHEAIRVLQPSGILAFCDYSLVRQPKNWFERKFLECARWLWQVPKANVYGNEEFRKKLTEAGFENITIDSVGKNTIVGYYFEHRRPESVQAMKKIRGFWKGVVGGYLIDVGVYGAYKMGLCEYIIVRAEKPAQLLNTF
ncbi:MAG: hypothetical protein A2788_01875 [Candidatus Abawacabacteria bacterium RIFCSPHIGHO2_01_FULL_46_8]|uniref:Methyltransferase type 11 domain-containing protein n=1 Tax=Candidatus Abawacabacteria bacterium RIFCSPHIGHO2_01_FULL_46_8 TaxID=1817815 RepID=A0A1F4XLV9_9BACT|nr:MAG: hypothetical protein A2788_01875 [Candidatus Abawacabacteria bacterium RIFCSPHIGHO2_01_FULL_46_8]